MEALTRAGFPVCLRTMPFWWEMVISRSALHVGWSANSPTYGCGSEFGCDVQSYILENINEDKDCFKCERPS